MANRLFRALKLLRPSPPSDRVTPSRLPERAGGPQPPTPIDHAERVLAAVEAGDPEAALEACDLAIHEWPRSADLWFLRFNLLLAAEDLVGAAGALQTISNTDPLNAPGAGVCLELLEAELQRRDLFLEGRGEPGTTGPLPPAARAALAAVQAAAAGDVPAAEAAAARARSAPRLQGHIDDRPFRELRDAQDLTGPVLEALAAGRYLWLPFEELAWIEILPIRTLLDHLWVPAHIETRAGKELRVHIPALYVGSSRHGGRVQLGQDTVWEALSPGLSLAAGQRRLQTHDQVLNIRHVKMINFRT